MTWLSVAAALVAGCMLVFGWWRFFFFHRNPPRIVPPGTDPVCPADGRILYVETVDMGRAPAADQQRPLQEYHRRVQEVFPIAGRWNVAATYLGILDVHVVRAPIAGRVRLRPIAPVGGNASMGMSFLFAAARRPLPVGRRDYLGKNEFLGVEIEGDIRMLVVLMADWWIDQIVPFIEDGETVERGQAIGRIRMGSQVDVWGPADRFLPARRPVERVRAGESVLGSLQPISAQP